MALQAGLATSRILLIVGASVAGSILVKNGNFSDFLDDTYKVLVKHLKHDSEHSNQSSVDPNLLAQLSRLRQELSSLASERSSVTIVSGSSNSNGSLIRVAVPALLIGATGYGYMRWKGLSLSDFMYVTRRSMSDAVASVSKQFDHVSMALSATKRHLTSKLECLSGNLDQNMEAQADLKNEVSLVRGDVEKYGLEIETVQRLVQTLGVKIDTIESKQDMANMGVVYLCNFVEKMQITQPPPEAIQGVHRPRLEQPSRPQMTLPSPEAVQGVHRPRLERGGSSSLGSIGLKDLESISNAIESAGTNTETLATSSSVKSPIPSGSSDIATDSNAKSSSPSGTNDVATTSNSKSLSPNGSSGIATASDAKSLGPSGGNGLAATSNATSPSPTLQRRFTGSFSASALTRSFFSRT
eukprot:c16834_g1_i1 orf=304-1539(+)